MKDSEASEASKSSQASYASIASPQILYYLESTSVAAKIAPEAPRGIFGEILGTPPEILGSLGRNNQGGVGPLGPKIC